MIGYICTRKKILKNILNIKLEKENNPDINKIIDELREKRDL